jgi:glycosyltransferase involved in cell wall biosynthesis
MKRRICMVVTNSLRKDPRVQRETMAAVGAGYDVVVIGQMDKFYDEGFLRSLPYRVDLVRLGRRMDSTRNFFLRAIRSVYRFWSFVIKAVRARPDLIHCNDLNTLLQGWITSRLTRCRIVYDSHEVNVPLGVKTLSRKQRMDKWREAFLIHKVNRVVCVSHAAAELIASHYGIEPLVVTNSSYRAKIDIAAGKETARFLVLYHGIMSSDRGYEEFVLSAALLPERARLILRGYGPSEPALRRLVEEKGLGGKVEFAPPVEIKDLIIKAAESHLGVVLTKPANVNYTFTVGNKVFEYINAGLPVLLSDVPEHRYLADTYGLGLVVKEVTPECIAEAIIGLMTDEEKYRRLRENAIKASEVLCWDNESKKLTGLYAELLAAGAGGRGNT